MSFSLGAKSTPRLCCHQEGTLSDASQEIDITELSHLKEVRDLMENGAIPLLCKGCYQLEEAGCFSPRQDYINRFGQETQIGIRYLDVTFNNDCNLECIMCSPVYSYKLNKFYHKELNLPQEKQWQVELTSKLLEKMLPTLEVITITGGEPFVSKKILDFIELLSEKKFAKNITLRIFTNLTQMSVSIIRVLEKFKKVELLLSVDSVGSNYELIRYPASWDKLTSNINFLNSNRFPHLDIHLHVVLMSVNWPHIGELIKFHSKYINNLSVLPIFVEIDTPSFLHPGVLPDKEFDLGISNIEKEVSLLGDKVSPAQKEGLELLLNKVKSRRNSNLYLQYKVFLSKLNKARQDEK